MSCIYVLVLESAPEDYRYIGRTSYPPRERLSNHMSQAKSGRNTHLYKWVRKAILDNQKIEIIVLEDNLTFKESAVREIYFIKEFRSQGFNLTNATDGGEGVRGFVPSAETREKARIASTGKKPSIQTRKKISIALKGRETSDETRAKLSAANMGHILSPETRAKIGAAGIGRKVSDETRKKKSISMMGKKNALGMKHSEETKAKISRANKGKKISEETRRKIGQANSGRTPSLETREKLRIANTGKKMSDENREVKDSEYGKGNKRGNQSKNECRKTWAKTHPRNPSKD